MELTQTLSVSAETQVRNSPIRIIINYAGYVINSLIECRFKWNINANDITQWGLVHSIKGFEMICKPKIPLILSIPFTIDKLLSDMYDGIRARGNGGILTSIERWRGMDVPSFKSEDGSWVDVSADRELEIRILDVLYNNLVDSMGNIHTIRANNMNYSRESILTLVANTQLSCGLPSIMRALVEGLGNTVPELAMKEVKDKKERTYANGTASGRRYNLVWIAIYQHFNNKKKVLSGIEAVYNANIFTAQIRLNRNIWEKLNSSSTDYRGVVFNGRVRALRLIDLMDRLAKTYVGSGIKWIDWTEGEHFHIPKVLVSRMEAVDTSVGNWWMEIAKDDNLWQQIEEDLKYDVGIVKN